MRACVGMSWSRSQLGRFQAVPGRFGFLHGIVTDGVEDIGSSCEATTEEVKSYYWWEGKVNFDPEWRVALKTAATPEAVEHTVWLSCLLVFVLP